MASHCHGAWLLPRTLEHQQIHIYINSWLYGTLTLLEVALVCWRRRNNSKHTNWMNLATHVACLTWSRTLKCGNTLNLQDFHCSAKVGQKRRAHISKGKRTIWYLVTWDGRAGKKCFPFEIPTVRGPREEGRIAPEKCLLSTRERSLYHLGWHLTQTRLQIIAWPSWLDINNIMHEHNVWFTWQLCCGVFHLDG